MAQADKLILVTGATGTQGGATVLSLLETGFRVRALVRNPDAENARAMAVRGVELAKGDWNDQASLVASMAGAYGAFSVQRPDTDGSDSERRHGFALIKAAREAGIQHFVHTSVCEAGKHSAFPRWETGYWGRSYWLDKWDVEEAVRAAGFPLWTVLKPAFIMENYVAPKVSHMFPHLSEGTILSALHPSSRLQLVAAESIGAFAQAAFSEPKRFNEQNIDLATEALTMDEVAATLQRVLNKP
jgi:uncharacterized protein YbjT (DUF2867 family)